MNAAALDVPSSLTQALVQAAAARPQRGVTLVSGRQTSDRRTYVELLQSCSDAAGRLVAIGVRPGDPVLISLPTSWPLVETWLGALLSRALPIAVAPMAPFGGVDAAVTRLEQLMEILGISCVITSETLCEAFSPHHGRRCFSTAQLARAEVRANAVCMPSSSIAFLQLTSGTQRTPRAAMISHAAAIQNVVALREAVQAPADARPLTSVVSWLPLHHDMGLVGALLLAIVSGYDLCLLPPKVFLAWPQLWLDHIAKRSGVLTLTPNFGLQLCVDRGARYEPESGSHTKTAIICGGEMLRAETLLGFTAANGLPPSIVRPGYGLAEAALAVTVDRKGVGPRTRPAPQHAARRFALSEVVCLGPPLPGIKLRIETPDRRTAEDGREGEVLVSGATLFSGYFNDPIATRRVLRDGWLHTGDIGFIADGELYLTGRRDDRIIVRGANFSPHELEWIAESIADGGGAHRCAAFSVAVDSRGEQAVLVVETSETDPMRLDQMGREIRDRAAERLALQLADVVFLRRGRLPRTTSGKIRRQQAREQYERGNLTHGRRGQ